MIEASAQLYARGEITLADHEGLVERLVRQSGEADYVTTGNPQPTRADRADRLSAVLDDFRGVKAS